MDSVGPDSDQLLPGLDGSAGDAAVLRIRLGGQLRRLREAAGITPEQAGFEIRASRSKISRLETGRVRLKGRDVQDLLTLYGVTDESVLEKVLALVRQSNSPDWWAKYNDILPEWFEAYLGLESAASTIRSFEIQFVHGLFQTEDYARAVTRPGGGPAVMRAQLRHLIKAGAMPHVTLQVVPFSRGRHAAESGSFTVLRFEERDLPDVVYLEQLTGAIYLDQRSDVEQYLEVVDELSGEALTPDATTRFIEQVAMET